MNNSAVRRIDHVVLVIIFLLLGVGLVQVYSSSYVYAIETRGDGLFFFKRQVVFAIAGFLLLGVTALLPWGFWRRMGPWIWILGVAGVLATYIPGLGASAGGAARWLRVGGGFHLEPSEFLKVALPLYLAWAMTLENKNMRWVAFAGLMLPLAALLKQPDFGSFAICVAVSFCLVATAGLSLRWILGTVLASIPTFYFLVMLEPYRQARMLAYLDPWSDPASKGFQVIQSLLSFHSGGVFGVGLGQGQGKLFFLPESHTDFTLAVLGEELGFIGFVIVMLLFLFIIFRGFYIAYNVYTKPAMLTALGVTTVIAFSVMVNAGVSLGIFPTKGLAMPFLSYGGSNLLAVCWGLGLILSIDADNRCHDS